jgi:hypothetical protein
LRIDFSSIAAPLWELCPPPANIGILPLLSNNRASKNVLKSQNFLIFINSSKKLNIALKKTS